MNKPQLRNTAKRFLRKVGYDVNKYVAGDYSQRPAANKFQLLKYYNIDVVFDVGANTGRYGTELRHAGYTGRIISFEPLSSSYKQLRTVSANDELWETTQSALGDVDGAAEINISSNPQFSSILKVMPEANQTVSQPTYVGKEEVVISRLDTILDAFIDEEEKLFLKIDAPGYVKQILDGAVGVIHKIAGIQVKTSLVTMYEGEYLINDMISYVKDLGFNLTSIEPGFSNLETGQLVQADLLFFRQ